MQSLRQAFIEASKCYGGAPVVDLLLDADDSDQLLTHVDKEGFTGLMNAVKFGSMEVVRVLLARNADPNYANWAGESAVHLAASSGIVDLVKMLINSSRSINLDAQDENGTVVTYIQVPLDSLSLSPPLTPRTAPWA